MLCLFIVYWYLICMIDLHKGIIPHMLIYLMNVFVFFLFTWSIHLSFMSMDLIYLLRFEPNNYFVSFVYRHVIKSSLFITYMQLYSPLHHIKLVFLWQKGSNTFISYGHFSQNDYSEKRFFFLETWSICVDESLVPSECLL